MQFTVFIIRIIVCVFTLHSERMIFRITVVIVSNLLYLHAICIVIIAVYTAFRILRLCYSVRDTVYFYTGLFNDVYALSNCISCYFDYTTTVAICQANLRLIKRSLFPRNRPGLTRKPAVISGNISPLILRKAVRSLTEIFIDIFLPPKLNTCRLECFLVARSVSHNTAVLLLSHCTLHLAHLLLGFVCGISLALVGKGRRVDVLKLLLGVNRLGNAYYDCLMEFLLWYYS